MAHHLLVRAIHAKVAAEIPIEGIRMVGAEKETWYPIYPASMTEAEKVSHAPAFAAVIAAFDVEAEEAILEAIEPSQI